MDLYTFGAAVAAFLVLWTIRWLRKPFQFWSNQGVPGPTPIWIFGNLLNALGRWDHVVQLERYKKYGRVYGYYDGTEPVLVVGEPELVHQICGRDVGIFNSRCGFPVGHSVYDDNIGFTTDGAIWKRQRDVVVSMFNMGRMKKTMWPRLSSSVEEGIQDMHKLLVNTSKVDLAQFFFPVFMRHIGSSAFHWDVLSEGPNFVKELSNAFAKDTFQPILFTLGLKDTPEFHIKSAIFLEEYLKKLVDERRADPAAGQYNDYMDLMLGLQEGVPPSLARKISELTEKEIIGEVISTLESFKATYSTFCYLLCHMGSLPAIQEKVYDEILTHTNSEGTIDYDDLKNLEYLDAVMAESARLNPITAYHHRAPNQDYKLENIRIPKRTRVQIPIYSMHRDEKLFPEPEVFRPERFMGQQTIVPGSYLPMGIGGMQCGGLRYGQLQVKWTIINFVRSFRFVSSPEPVMCPRHQFTLLPLHIDATVEKR